MTDPAHRRWFDRKRVGYGFRPQTWQGLLITTVLAVVLALIIIALLR